MVVAQLKVPDERQGYKDQPAPEKWKKAHGGQQLHKGQYLVLAEHLLGQDQRVAQKCLDRLSRAASQKGIAVGQDPVFAIGRK